MPITKITYEVSRRNIVYIGEYGKGLTISYGPVITTDPKYDPEKDLDRIEAELNERLKEQEIAAWLKDPTQIPTMIEATKEEYYAIVAEREKALTMSASLEQAKAEVMMAAKERVKPEIVKGA